MNTEGKNRFAEWEKKLNAYQFALTVIGIDANDRPPYEGAAIRNEHTAFLHGELFSLENDAEMYEIMKGLRADPDLDEVTRRKVQIVGFLLCVIFSQAIPCRAGNSSTSG